MGDIERRMKMEELLDELYEEIMESMLKFGGEEDTKSRMREILKKTSISTVYEDGYGDDGLPVYKCPSCFIEIGEHQEVCETCRHIIVGW